MFSKLPILLELAMLRPVVSRLLQGGGFKFGYNRGILWLLISHRGLHVWFGTCLIYMVKMLHIHRLPRSYLVMLCPGVMTIATVVETLWFADVTTNVMIHTLWSYNIYRL